MRAVDLYILYLVKYTCSLVVLRFVGLISHGLSDLMLFIRSLPPGQGCVICIRTIAVPLTYSYIRSHLDNDNE